jgi:hypothetical protein
MYQVLLGKRLLKQIERMPSGMQDKLGNLVEDLKLGGPVQTMWPNYSKLSLNKYHCHLSYKWVACWYHEKGTVRIEVYYAGSRENAPY